MISFNFNSQLPKRPSNQSFSKPNYNDITPIADDREVYVYNSKMKCEILLFVLINSSI